MIHATCLTLLLALGFPPLQDIPEATLQAGQAQLGAGDYATAASTFRALTESEPQNGRAWMLWGYALHAEGKTAEAIPVHERAATFPAVAVQASYNAACAHALEGHLDEAFDWMQRAVTAGFGDRVMYASDPDLAALRGDARFDRVLPPFLEGDELFVEDARVIHQFIGEAAGDQFGWVARTVGDVDGDGVEDFATTAPTRKSGGPYAGRVYVYSSRSGALLFQCDGQPGDGLGTSVAGGMDVNGDGTPDVIAGAPGSGARPGRAFVYSGKDGAVLHTLTTGEPGDGFGIKVGGIEDLDGDGCDELVVGAWKADTVGVDAGAVTLYSGKTGAPMYTLAGATAGEQFGSSTGATLSGGHRLLIVGAMLAGPQRRGRCHVYRCGPVGAELLFSIEASPTGVHLGQYFVAILGDVDGDGVPDVYGSDWDDGAAGPRTGQVFVHSGRTGERLLAVRGRVPGEGFGTSESVAGDANGDGHADLIVGAWQNAEGATSGGKCYLVSGKDGSDLATWTSKQAGDTLGFDAVGLGDVDGDGSFDFLLTSAWSAPRGAQTGRVFIVSGEHVARADRADEARADAER